MSAAGRPAWRAVAARAASLLLRYPDEPVLAAVPLIDAATRDLPDPVGGALRLVSDHRAATPASELAAEYVRRFDLRRRCALHLTYFTSGDTRARGAALVEFAAAFAGAGLAVVDGELPDFLPAVLDLAAVDEAGWRLLAANRVGVDLLAQALAAEGSVYRHALDAVRAMLPPPRPGDRAAVARLTRHGPPAELVGLEPYGAGAAIGGHR